MDANNERPLTTAEAVQNFRKAWHDAVYAPLLLPPLTRILDWLVNMHERLSQWQQTSKP